MPDTIVTPAEPTPVVQPVVQPVVEPVVQPVVQPTPVVEPVAQPVVEPVVEPVVTAPEKTGIPFYDNAADVLVKAGVDAGAILEKVNEAGDITPDIRKELVDKLGESQTYMLEQGYKAQRQAENAERTAVYDSVGGEEAWKAIAEWTASDKNTLTEEQITEYNGMLAQGGEAAKLAAAKIKEAFVQDPTNNIPAQSMQHGDTQAPAPGVMQPISRSDYTTQKKEAIKLNDAAKVQQLEARARFTQSKHPDQWRPVMGRY